MVYRLKTPFCPLGVSTISLKNAQFFISWSTVHLLSFCSLFLRQRAILFGAKYSLHNGFELMKHVFCASLFYSRNRLTYWTFTVFFFIFVYILVTLQRSHHRKKKTKTLSHDEKEKESEKTYHTLCTAHSQYNINSCFSLSSVISLNKYAYETPIILKRWSC